MQTLLSDVKHVWTVLQHVQNKPPFKAVCTQLNYL